MAREPAESRPLRTRSGRGRVCSTAKAKQPRVSVNKSEQTPGDLLSFASGYFSESNLFNWLQAIQKEKRSFPLWRRLSSRKPDRPGSCWASSSQAGSI
jgi:hypothetical protein